MKVVSARETCSEGIEEDSTKWKLKCFMNLHETFKLRTDYLCNLIVVGDSMNEIIAG